MFPFQQAWPQPWGQIYAVPPVSTLGGQSSHGSGAIGTNMGLKEKVVKFTANMAGAVSKFNGRVNEDAKEWMQAFKEVVRANNWNNDQTLIRFKMCLGDSAKQWWYSLTQDERG